MPESFSEGKRERGHKERKKGGRDKGRKHMPLNDCGKSKSGEVLEREQKLPAGARPFWAASSVCIVRLPLHLWQMPAWELWAFPDSADTPSTWRLPLTWLPPFPSLLSLARKALVHEKSSVDYLQNETISKIGVRSVAADSQRRDSRT